MTILMDVNTAREALGDSLGFYYYRNRVMDPTTGRFISEDPLGYIDGPNRYIYVRNMPWKWNDPFGLTDQGGSWFGGRLIVDGNCSTSVWGIDGDNGTIYTVLPGDSSPEGVDIDYVKLGDTWRKVGGLRNVRVRANGTVFNSWWFRKIDVNCEKAYAPGLEK